MIIQNLIYLWSIILTFWLALFAWWAIGNYSLILVPFIGLWIALIMTTGNLLLSLTIDLIKYLNFVVTFFRLSDTGMKKFTLKKLLNFRKGNLLYPEIGMMDIYLSNMRNNFWSAVRNVSVWNLFFKNAYIFCPKCWHPLTANFYWLTWPLSCPDCHFMSKNLFWWKNDKLFFLLKNIVTYSGKTERKYLILWKDSWILKGIEKEKAHHGDRIEIELLSTKEQIKTLFKETAPDYQATFIFLDDFLQWSIDFFEWETERMGIHLWLTEFLTFYDNLVFLFLPDPSSTTDEELSTLNKLLGHLNVRLSKIEEGRWWEVVFHEEWNASFFSDSEMNLKKLLCENQFKIETSIWWIIRSECVAKMGKDCISRVSKSNCWYVYILPSIKNGSEQARKKLIKTFIERYEWIFRPGSWYLHGSAGFLQYLEESVPDNVNIGFGKNLSLTRMLLSPSRIDSFFHKSDYLVASVLDVLALLFSWRKIVDLDNLKKRLSSDEWKQESGDNTDCAKINDIEIEWLFAIEVKGTEDRNFPSPEDAIKKLENRANRKNIKGVLIVNNYAKNPNIRKRRGVSPDLIKQCSEKNICIIYYRQLWELLFSFLFGHFTEAQLISIIQTTKWELSDEWINQFIKN